MTEPRWYCVSTDGNAFMCEDKDHADRMSKVSDECFKRHAPHRAVQLVDAAELEKLKAELDEIAGINHGQWLALENCRMLAQRSSNEEWAWHITRFCAEAGSLPTITRRSDGAGDAE